MHLHVPFTHQPLNEIKRSTQPQLSCSSLVVSKHGLYAGSPGSIPTAVTTRTAAGGDAEHVSLNH